MKDVDEFADWPSDVLVIAVFLKSRANYSADILVYAAIFFDYEAVVSLAAFYYITKNLH